MKKHIYIYNIFFYGIVFLPGFLMVMFNNVGSNFFGVMIISILTIILGGVFELRENLVPKPVIIIATGGLIFIVIHSVMTFFLFNSAVESNVSKSIFSIFAFIIILFSLFLVTTSINAIDNNDFSKAINCIFYILIFIGVIISARILLGLQSNKKMFFFTEPSYYALIISILFNYKLRIDIQNVIFILPLLIIAVSIENFTLIIGVILSMGFVFIKPRTLPVTSILLLILYLVGSNFLSSDKLRYYSERVNISENSKNTSTLTLLSGYEQALLSIKDTYGLGYGIQTMGYLNERGKIVDIISSLRDGNSSSNLHDGGFFLSKLIVEFGIFGLVFFVSTLRLLIKSYQNKDKKIVFFTSVIYVSIIYFLMRGSGYFTPTAILLFLACIFIMQDRYKHTSRSN